MSTRATPPPSWRAGWHPRRHPGRHQPRHPDLAARVTSTPSAAVVVGVAVVVVVMAASLQPTAALDNGVATTPPMGFNTYMSGLSGAKGMGTIADFFVSSGLQRSGYSYVNSDEGWETNARDPKTGKLVPSPTAFPGGMQAFVDGIHAKGLKVGLYGASSGVTCGTDPGQLFHEDIDAQTYAGFGIDYIKLDNCASYALDSTVRFAAMRDALNRTGRPIVVSIEPFSVNPDPSQGPQVSNLWRVGVDIRGDFSTFTNRADVSDKWSPLAGPGGWNDPDMINVGTDKTLGENRMYFGLWAIMKAPLLLSANLPALPAEVIGVVNNSGAIAINQDAMGVQARKLTLGAMRLPWLAGLESCAPEPGLVSDAAFHSRTMDPQRGGDTRLWTVTPAGGADAGTSTATADATRRLPRATAADGGAVQIVNTATGRCLDVLPNDSTFGNHTVALTPCDASSATQTWAFDNGLTTVSSITNAGAKLALAASNTTLYGTPHGKDAFQVNDAAYSLPSLTLAPRYAMPDCTSRNCQGYDPSQMWFYSATDGLLRQSLYTASINHAHDGAGYQLTQKVPTWRHHCLAHVLSDDNTGTFTNSSTETWGGPLAGGDFVLGLANRGEANATITAPFDALEIGGIGASSAFRVHDVWADRDLGVSTGSVTLQVETHDLAILRLTPA